MSLLRLFSRSATMSEAGNPKVTKVKQRAATIPEPMLSPQQLVDLAAGLPEEHLHLFRKLIASQATEFHHFLDLPKGIRKKIWRFTFPERDIVLRVQYRHGDYKKIDFGLPLPMTYWVNRESRKETVAHYNLYSQRPAFSDKNGIVESRPTWYCFNLEVDKFSVPFLTLWSNDYSCFLDSFFEYVPQAATIRVLTVKDVHLTPLLLNERDEKKIGRALAKSLTRFHHLKELRFILNPREELHSEFVQYWQSRVIEAFEVERAQHGNCSMPKILIITWQDQEIDQALKLGTMKLRS